MTLQQSFKLTFTPKHLAQIIQAGMKAKYGIEFDDKLTECVSITKGKSPQGRDNTMTETYLLEFHYEPS